MKRFFLLFIFVLFSPATFASDHDSVLSIKLSESMGIFEKVQFMYKNSVYFLHVMQTYDTCELFTITMINTQLVVDDKFKPHYYSFWNNQHFLIYVEPNTDLHYLDIFNLQPIDDVTTRIFMDKLSEYDITGVDRAYEITHCQDGWYSKFYKNADVIPIERTYSLFYKDFLEKLNILKSR